MPPNENRVIDGRGRLDVRLWLIGIVADIEMGPRGLQKLATMYEQTFLASSTGRYFVLFHTSRDLLKTMSDRSMNFIVDTDSK